MPTLRGIMFNFSLMFSDILMLLSAFFITFWLRYHSGIFKAASSSLAAYSNMVAFSVLLMLIIFQAFRLYQEKRTLFDEDEFFILVKAVFLAFLIVITATFFFKATAQFSRVVLTATFAISIPTASMGRLTLRAIQAAARKRGINTRNVLIIGDGSLAQMVSEKIKDHLELGYVIKGILRPNQLKRFGAILEGRDISVVFIATRIDHNRLAELMARHDHVRYKLVPSLIETMTEAPSYEEFKDIPLVILKERDAVSSYLKWKRSMDFSFSVIALIIISPIFLIISLLILLASRGGVFYRHRRVGKNGQVFLLYKFRTMRKGADRMKPKSELNSPLFSMRKDPRVTFIGRILRRTCLDELPQLLNVIRGEMSLIGPRPHLPEELKEFKRWQHSRLQVRPGMTGLWQVSGRHELNFEKTMMLDLYYVKHLSLWLDLKILFKTIPSIIFSGGRW
ncbi:MAG: sugar transferase [Nanoarchaeota archaeon]|nr:sugar transferase [Nanoarchaeota archaeon]